MMFGRRSVSFPLLVVLLKVCTGKNTVCKLKRFQSVFTDFVMTDMIIAAYQVDNELICMSHCNKLDDQCQSFNYEYSAKENAWCEISNITLQQCPARRKQKEGFVYYENTDAFPQQAHGSEANPATSCFSIEQMCGKSEGEYWIKYNNNKILLYCYHDKWTQLASDVCVGAKGDQFGQFRYTGNYSVLVDKIKLVHKSGSVGCHTTSSTHWGCVASKGDVLCMLVTDTNKNILYPLLGNGCYKLPGYTSSSPELILGGDVQLLTTGQQMQIWYGEDWNDSSEGDNHGRTCMDVWVHVL